MQRKRVGFLKNIVALLLLFGFLNVQHAASASVPKQSLGKAGALKKSAMNTNFCNVVVTAHHYKINIDPVIIFKEQNGDNATTKPFPAETFALAKIKLRVLEIRPCNETSTTGSAITINPRGCGISGDTLEITHLGSGDKLTVSEQSVYSKEKEGQECSTEKCEILLEEKLAPGDELELSSLYTLKLTRNYVENKWQGFYYYNPTHFENNGSNASNYPLHTQHIFPTFEQDPIKKATFELSVSRRKTETEGCVAISNADLLESKDAPGISSWTIDQFGETPPLPFDQVAVMLLGGFQKHTVYDNSSNASDNNGTQINVWSFGQVEEDVVRNKRINRTAEEALMLFQFYNGVFNQTAYPLGKIDFIAVPWATEDLCWTSNFGLVANQEDHLLLNEIPYKATTPNSEIAFQWIGGMVTSPELPDERNDVEQGIFLYSNALLEYVASWSKGKNRVMSTASNCASFELEAAQLGMLDSVLSRQVMQSAIADIYLPNFKFKKALPTDFQDAIQQAVENQNKTHLLPNTPDEKLLSIREIFTSWQINKDYKPQILVNSTEISEDNSSSLVSLSQVDPIGEISPKEFWWVPVKILSENGTEMVWLSPNTSKTNNESTELKNTFADKWFILNPDGKGYYSVKYDEIQLDNIVTQLKNDHTVLPEEGRVFLINNQFELPIKSDESQWDHMKGALELTRYLENELSVPVWTAVIRHVSYFHNTFRLKGEEEFKQFSKYFSFLMNSVLEKVALEPDVKNATEVNQTDVIMEDENTLTLTTKLMESCSLFELVSCKNLARKLMTEWMKSPEVDPFSKYPADIQQELYCSAVQWENEDEKEHQIFDFLLDQLVTSEKSTNKLQIAKALACSNKMELLKALLNDTRLANGSEQLQKIYREDFPSQLYVNWPHRMIREVYQFWMTDLLEGKTSPTAFMKHLWVLVKAVTYPPGFVDEILKFLEDHNDLFSTDDDLMKDVDDFKESIKSNLSPDTNQFWNDTGNKMVEWFIKNSPK